MSIYATGWSIMVPTGSWGSPEWVEVYVQFVPCHIGHPKEYPEGDPYSEFLPPPVTDEEYEQEIPRAAVIVQSGRTEKEGQRYVDPVLVLSGREYLSLPFAEMLQRIYQGVKKPS